MASGLGALLCSVLLAPGVAGATTHAAVPAPSTRVGTPSADFAIRFLQDSRSVTAGERVTYALRVKPTGRFAGRVEFELPNMIAGVSSRFIPGATVHEWTLQISVPTSVPPQSGVFILRGSSGSLVRTAQFRLTVNPARGGPLPATVPTSVRATAPGATVTAPTVARPSAPSPSTVSPSALSPSTVSPSALSPSTVSASTLSPSTVSPSTVSPSTVSPSTPATTNPATTAAPTGTAGTDVPAESESPKPAYVDNPQGARQKAAAYAYTWALGTNPDFALYAGGKITVPSDNPDAKGRAIDAANKLELDCTNFMSQALRIAGFAYLPTWRYDATRHVATAAWVRAAGPGGMSTTFVKYGRMRLVNPKGTALGEPPPPGIQIGDIVVWDLNARHPMHIDHQLMVTDVSGAGTSWGDIRVSYHTYDHRNRAMDEYQNFVAPDAPKARLYVFHVAYPS